MDNNIKKRRELVKAVLNSIEENGPTKELEAQVKELKQDSELLDFYVDFMIQHSGMVQAGVSAHGRLLSDKQLDFSVIDSIVATQLLLEERSAPAMEEEKAENVEIEEKPTVLQLFKRYYPLVGMFAILASCLVFMSFWLDRHDDRVVVAQVVDEFQVKWADRSTHLARNAFLFDDKKSYYLAEGSLKIQFEDGARVVVSGPATFAIKDRDRMSMESGKLFAHVPKAATGFRVDTPSCGVVDLGTEFGIDVNSSGFTDVHLCKGKAMLVPSSKSVVSDSEIITENEARRVLDNGNISRITFRSTAFLREFDSKDSIVWKGQSLSLADIVTGGTGFGRAKENVGIDHRDGKWVTGNVENKENDQVDDYVSVDDSPFIDGIFVPNGGNGPVTVTSAGHTYGDIDKTTGSYYMPIGVYYNVETSYHGGEYMDKSICLKGFKKETSQNLCLHANSGITFDLQAIANSIGFAKIKSFTSHYGVPVTFEEQESVMVDFAILIDGKPVWAKRDVSNQEDPGYFEIPISKEDRFLTLICTEGIKNLGDWSVFVDPVLVLEQAD